MEGCFSKFKLKDLKKNSDKYSRPRFKKEIEEAIVSCYLEWNRKNK